MCRDCRPLGEGRLRFGLAILNLFSATLLHGDSTHSCTSCIRKSVDSRPAIPLRCRRNTLRGELLSNLICCFFRDKWLHVLGCRYHGASSFQSTIMMRDPFRPTPQNLLNVAVWHYVESGDHLKKCRSPNHWQEECRKECFGKCRPWMGCRWKCSESASESAPHGK